LIEWFIFFFLDIFFEVLNYACWLDFKSDGFISEDFLDFLKAAAEAMIKLVLESASIITSYFNKKITP
jgi:hypothetical protein